MKRLGNLLAYLVMFSFVVGSNLALLEEDQTESTQIGNYAEYFYPGLIGYNFMSAKGNSMNVSGKRFMVFGNPGSYTFLYGDFPGSIRCGDYINNNIQDAACYLNSIDFSWELCSKEWKTCNFNGSTIIRFGEGSKYYIFHKSGGFPCNVNNLGDPSPGREKHCGFLTQRWIKCCDEWKTCYLGNETKLVRYGTMGRYYIKEVTNQINCNNKTWGDPIKEDKTCDFLPYTYKWVECARGRNICRFFGVSIVKFEVASNNYYFKEAAFEIECEEGRICYYARY